MTQRNHKYKHGRRITNPYTMIISTAIFCIWLISGNDYDDAYVQEPDVFMKPVVVEVPKEETVEEKIMRHFPKNGVTMVAIAKAESRLNNNAIGYNCYYYQGKATTTPIKGGSKACKVADRHFSHSVDCFILQRNYPGRKTCPQNITLEQHLAEVADLSKIQGLQAWSSFNDGKHLPYLANN